MAEITFLGTGGSVATQERDNTSFLLRDHDATVLVDCPGSIIQKLRKLKVDPCEVRTVLLTHVHPDHVYGWPSFIHSLMLEEGEIQLYGSATTIDLARRLLDLFGLRKKSVKMRVKWKTLTPGRKYGLTENWSFKPFRVPHHPSSLAYHFYWERERKDAVLSGDTPLFLPLFEEARGATCLVHDCGAPSWVFRRYPELSRMHTNSLDLGKACQEADVELLVPIHFLGEVNFSLAAIAREIRKHFRDRLLVPRDLMTIRI